MKVIGIMTRWTVKGSLLGKMANIISDSIRTIRRMDSA
jgi:hypothetical protein